GPERRQHGGAPGPGRHRREEEGEPGGGADEGERQEVRGVATGLEGGAAVGSEEPDGDGMEEQREKKPAEPAPPEGDEAREREGGEGPVAREEEPSPLHAVVERASGADPPRSGQALGPTEEPALDLGRDGGRDDPPDGVEVEADSGEEGEPRDG